jgi:RNA polymerase sigma-70 factor (ECF subfamily)
MLHPAVRLIVDGGGVVAAPGAALEGASEVGGYLFRALRESAGSLRVESVNGLPGIVLCREGRVTGVLAVRVRCRRIVEAWLVLNPEKLTRWNAD